MTSNKMKKRQLIHSIQKYSRTFLLLKNYFQITPLKSFQINQIFYDFVVVSKTKINFTTEFIENLISCRY